MCDRCNALDRDLANFQRLRSSIRDVFADVFAVALIAAEAKDLRSERGAHHVNDARKSGP